MFNSDRGCPEVFFFCDFRRSLQIISGIKIPTILFIFLPYRLPWRPFHSTVGTQIKKQSCRRNCSDDIVTGYRMNGWGFIPCRDYDFSVLHSDYTQPPIQLVARALGGEGRAAGA
jgi:hypothetical protein